MSVSLNTERHPKQLLLDSLNQGFTIDPSITVYITVLYIITISNAIFIYHSKIILYYYNIFIVIIYYITCMIMVLFPFRLYIFHIIILLLL